MAPNIIAQAKKAAKAYKKNRKGVGNLIAKTQKIADMAASKGIISKSTAANYGKAGAFLKKDKQF